MDAAHTVFIFKPPLSRVVSADFPRVSSFFFNTTHASESLPQALWLGKPCGSILEHTVMADCRRSFLWENYLILFPRGLRFVVQLVAAASGVLDMAVLPWVS